MPAVAPHALYTLDAATLKACSALARQLQRADADPSRRDARTRSKIAHDQHQLTPVAVPRTSAFWGRARSPRTASGSTPDDIAILKRRGVGVSHNPESNMKLASGTAPVIDYLAAGRRRRPRHRRRRQQQRPRHVRGDAPGGVPAEAGRDDPRAVSAPAGARDGDASAARARSGMAGGSARSRPGKRADVIVVSMTRGRGRRRCSIRSRTSSTSRAATMCERPSSTARC